VIKNFLARIGCLTIVAVVVGAGWWFRADIAGLWNRLEITSSSRPSEEIAARSERRLEAFASGSTEDVDLDQTEIQSLLTFRLEPRFPPGISEPLVEIRDSTVVLSARVNPRELEAVSSRELVERFFSDSARVLVELNPGVFQAGVAELQVVALQTGGILVPSLMVPWVLESLHLEGAEPAGTRLLVPLPVRIESFEVVDGRIRLTAR